ncbi:CinA family protein [Microbacterium sp. YY-03]|uniref:CinA family protein n=1 Tax=Microbacterium sp. YY-03 TaxID=3421636 RepID=UPI003D16E8EA
MSDSEALAAEAQSRGLRIGVVESLTSGKLAQTVGAGENAGDWFAGGIVAYLRDVKERLLGVDEGIDLCSARCAEQLAVGAAEVLRADVCVSTTGVGGPDAEDGHEPGTVFIGWYANGNVGSAEFHFDGEPTAVLQQTVVAAMRELAERAATNCDG